MKKILKYLLFVLTFCVVFFISFKINIHRLEFAPMKLMETEWDDSVGTVYVDLDYENENGNTYNLYVPANLDKEKEQYLILYIHGGSFNSSVSFLMAFTAFSISSFIRNKDASFPWFCSV